MLDFAMRYIRPDLHSSGLSDLLGIELDGSFVEVKTTDFKCLRLEDAVGQLADQEGLVLAVAKSGTHGGGSSARILPYSGYASLGQAAPPRQGCAGDAAPKDAAKKSRSKAKKKQAPEAPECQPAYAGSYHFWFTLPHDPATMMAPDAPLKTRLAAFREFADDHASFALALQWMEPLLLSLTTGDQRAPGNGAQYPRASMRGVLNYLSGAGRSPVCKKMPLLKGTQAVHDDLLYFASLADFKAACTGAPAPPQVRALSGAVASKVQLLFTADGATYHEYLGCHSMPRWAENRGDPSASGSFGTAGTSPQAHKALHNQVLLLKHGAGFVLSDNNDVRTSWCENFELPLQPGWQAVLVDIEARGSPPSGRQPPPRRLHFHFRHPATGKWTATAPLKKGHTAPGAAARDAVGFEFRFMDNMPNHMLMDILRLTAALFSRTLTGQTWWPL
ncbi:hypothetical protein HXX76_014141 [Chlamydomonas incerta]|uniref:Uncharacterized protein n=1 Tax=Chlamydomonas incerta TaxID=51695 RepID=A0A835SK62_CHLIN|nr:hypothetical protein HXX76_014141 [Chlamydomonas incerta]|eukprot:KAG2424983.1 hypothetical protein HXX76_014141 [Chlamydomonas incerta]